MITSRCRASIPVACLAIGVGLSGCVYRTISVQPVSPVKVDFDKVAIENYPSGEAITNLWKSFDDPALEALLKRALQENRSLQQVAARVDQARAVRGQAIAALFPETQVSAYRNAEVPSKLNPLIPPSFSKINTFQAGFDSAWEIDLFGVANYAAKATSADLQASESNLAAARQALIAETAQAYFSLRADQAHLELALSRAKAAQTLATIAQQRRAVGRYSDIDAATLESQSAAALSGLEPAKAAVDSDLNRLMVLTVLSTDQIKALVADHHAMPRLNSLIPVGNPTDWLARRPDVRAAEFNLRSAIARANVARGEYFPTITLTGFYGYNAQTAADIGRSASRQWNFGPSINWQFLNVGRTISDIRSSNAAARQALEQFDATVLVALQETNNALEGFKAASESLQHWQVAADTSRQQLDLNTRRAEIGAVDPLTAINAQLSYCDTADQLINAQLRQVSLLAQLYKALAGDITG